MSIDGVLQRAPAADEPTHSDFVVHDTLFTSCNAVRQRLEISCAAALCYWDAHEGAKRLIVFAAFVITHGYNAWALFTENKRIQW